LAALPNPAENQTCVRSAVLHAVAKLDVHQAISVELAKEAVIGAEVIVGASLHIPMIVNCVIEFGAPETASRWPNHNTAGFHHQRIV
jgi:hypothetical protein